MTGNRRVLLLATAMSGVFAASDCDAVEAQDAAVAKAQEQPTPSWTGDFTLGAYVDAYVALRSDSNDRRPAAVPGVASPSGYAHEAYVSADGFALASAGADISYVGDHVGAKLSLRFGPAVNRFYYADQGPLGIDNITQAYGTWKALDGLTLDLGQFYTIYGAEVFESFRNMNYSRGGLHYAMQPLWHTGLRANYAFSDVLGVTALAVNGVNTAFEGNKSPSVGIQALTTPVNELILAVGYLGALNPRDGNEGPVDADGDPTTPPTEQKFEHFIDVIATLTLGDFKVVNNFDLNLYRMGGTEDVESWWGVSVAPGYSPTNWFGVAARVEYLSDSANQVFGMAVAKPGDSSSLTTITGTLDIKPVPNRSTVVLRPEFRYELASDDYFLESDGAPTESFWSAHLGAVVTSM